MNLTYKQFWLFGVLMACPLHHPLDSCPFIHLRYEPVKIQYQFIKDLSNDELESLIRYHKDCLFKRIQKEK